MSIIHTKIGRFQSVEEYDAEWAAKAKASVDELMEQMVVEVDLGGHKIRADLNTLRVAEKLASCIALDFTIKQHLKFIYKKIRIRVKEMLK